MIETLKEKMESSRKSLNLQGFVHMKNVIPESSICEVRRLIDSLFSSYQSLPEKYTAIHGQETSDTTNREIYEINKATKLATELKRTEAYKICHAIASQLLNKTTYYSYDHAIYKSPDSGHVQWHQDQAYKQKVKVMQSVHLWIPLHDVSGEGGGMQYVSGSHKLPLVEHSKHQVSHTLTATSSAIDDNNIVVCDASLGDVIAHLPNTLHSSAPNKSSRTRKAWIVHFSPYGQLEPLLPHNFVNYLKTLAKHRKQKAPM